MNASLAEKIKFRSSNINLLRFICAAGVIICHSYAVTSGEEDFFSRFTNGQCNLGGVAVAVFFFLSGLYVTKSLEKGDSLWTFARKRCERIFPPLWVAVVLSVAAGAVISTLPLTKYLAEKGTYLYLLNGFLIPVHDLPGVFGGMPYSTVNGALWTLPVEAACYIGLVVLAVFAEKVLKNREKKKQLTMLVTGILIILLAFFQYKMHHDMLVSVTRAMVFFFEGVLFYEYRERIRLNPVIAAGMLILFLLLGLTPVFNFGMVILFPYSILGLTLALPQMKRDLKLFSLSYEMYLVGWPIQQIVMKICGKMSPTENWLITLPLDILIGWIVFKTAAMITRQGAKQKGKAEANESRI